MIGEFLIGAAIGFVVLFVDEELQLQRNQNTILTGIKDKLCKFDTDDKQFKYLNI